jgi:hypothetical protein
MLTTFPNNPGYLLQSLTKDELEPIWAEINCYPESGSDPVLHQSEKNFYLSNSRNYIEHLLAPYVTEYINGFKFNLHLDRNDVSNQLQLNDTWVTFQKKYDFNPAHCHRGQLSFVIWLKIPYTFEQEKNVAVRSQLDQGSKHLNGDFHFQWIDTTGAIRSHSMEADNKLEGHLCIFASSLYHQVFPYYSTDDTRISISGNWGFKTN